MVLELKAPTRIPSGLDEAQQARMEAYSKYQLITSGVFEHKTDLDEAFKQAEALRQAVITELVELALEWRKQEG